MKILTARQIREADAYTIANEPVSSIDLMERASRQLFEYICELYPEQAAFCIFTGPGNNGGDGLALARMLSGNGYEVEVYIVRFTDKSSDDFRINEERLQNTSVKVVDVKNVDDLPGVDENVVIVDAIFGSGLNRPAEGLAAEAIRHINKMPSRVISIDVPSGLFCEDNADNNKQSIVRSDLVLTFELPKLAFLLPENAEYVRAWDILPIGLSKEFIEKAETPYYYMKPEMIRPLLKHRGTFSHKGTFGHALLLTGSYGKIGASVLCTKACLRAGAGLVSVRTPSCGYTILQTAVPEAMADADPNEKYLTELPGHEKYDAIGIGPGIGKEKQTQNVVKMLIQNSQVPLVFDADAINILGENKTWISFVPAGCVFTPHPKEFERLVGKASGGMEKLKLQIEFSRKHHSYLVLKGAYTSIATPDGKLFFNSTGNPGLATGGTGDVLTGMITGLMARGYSSLQAAMLGVYWQGLAADVAVESTGEESMIAGDIVESLGESWRRFNG